jgi:hypothetical protein
MTVKITDTTMRNDHRSLLASCAVAGVALLVLSFQPWLSLHTTGGHTGGGTLSVAGNQVTALTNFGDGYLVAGLAAAMALAAWSRIMLGTSQRFAVSTISVSGFVTLGVALSNLLHDWPAEYPYYPLPGSLDIDIAPALWAVLVIGALTGFAGLALLPLQSDATRPQQAPTPARL